MPRGGARPGSGRPKGSRDSPLVLGRTLTNDEIRAITTDTQVLRAQVKLAAWTALAAEVANVGKLPTTRERIAVLQMAFRHTEDVTPTPEPHAPDPVPDGQVHVIRERLTRIAAAFAPQTLELQRAERIAILTQAVDADIIDAELLPDPRSHP